MSNTYTWQITNLNCLPNVDGKTDYVVTAHWTCSGTDGTYTGSVYNTQSFAVNADKPDYTLYADLTETQVIDWVQQSMGEEMLAALYANIDKQIEDQVNPPIVTPKLPWA